MSGHTRESMNISHDAQRQTQPHWDPQIPQCYQPSNSTNQLAFSQPPLQVQEKKHNNYNDSDPTYPQQRYSTNQRYTQRA